MGYEIVVAAGVVVIVEIGLIYSIQKLRKSLQKMNEEINIFKTKVTLIAENIGAIYAKTELMSKGEIHITGNTPIGKVDLDLKLGNGEGK